MRITSTPTAMDADTEAVDTEAADTEAVDTEVVDTEVSTLDALYQREFVKMVRIATLVGGSRGSAEEIVQDAFVRVHQRFDDLDNPGAYLRSCVVNGCRDRMRRRMRFDERRPVLATDASAPFEAAGSPDDRVDMARALAALPLRSRLVLVLRFYGGWTVPEIAEALDLPGGTVKTVIHRGLARLRKEIEP